MSCHPKNKNKNNKSRTTFWLAQPLTAARSRTTCKIIEIGFYPLPYPPPGFPQCCRPGAPATTHVHQQRRPSSNLLPPTTTTHQQKAHPPWGLLTGFWEKGGYATQTAQAGPDRETGDRRVEVICARRWHDRPKRASYISHQPSAAAAAGVRRVCGHGPGEAGPIAQHTPTHTPKGRGLIWGFGCWLLAVGCLSVGPLLKLVGEICEG